MSKTGDTDMYVATLRLSAREWVQLHFTN